MRRLFIVIDFFGSRKFLRGLFGDRYGFNSYLRVIFYCYRGVVLVFREFLIGYKVLSWAVICFEDVEVKFVGFINEV